MAYDKRIADEMMNREKERQNHLNHLVGMGIFWAIFFIVLLTALFGTFYTIDAGDRGIVLTMGKPSQDIMQPGLHFKIPVFQSVIKTSVRTQTVSFDNKQATGDNSEYSSLAGASKDLQDVAIGSVVNYHINEQDVLDIYKKYGGEQNYEKNILEPIIRETVKATSSQYTAEELVTKRQEFSDRVAQTLRDKFSIVSGVFEKYSVVNFEFSPEYTIAIEQKAVQAQLLEKSKIELETTKVQADTRIAQAEGEAKAIQIQVQAINQQGGQNYVELQRIQRWDGHYPQVMGSGVTPIVDMRSIVGATTTVFTTSTNETK